MGKRYRTDQHAGHERGPHEAKAPRKRVVVEHVAESV